MQLNIRLGKHRRLHAQQTDQRPWLAISPEELTHNRQQLGIDLGGMFQGARPGKSAEIGIAQFELYAAGMQPVFAEPAADFLDQLCQGSFKHLPICNIHRKRVLMTHRFGAGVLSDRFVKPSAGVDTRCLLGQCHRPIAYLLPQPLAAVARQISGRLYSQLQQMFLGDFPDSWNLAHRQRSQERPLAAGNNPQNAVRFRLAGADLRHHAGASDAYRTVQPRQFLHPFVQQMRRP